MKRFCAALAVALTILLLFAAGACMGLYLWGSGSLPDFSKVASSEKDMREVFFKNTSRIVSLEDLPAYLPNAFLAAEAADYLQAPPISLVDGVIRPFYLFSRLSPGAFFDCANDFTQQLATKIVADLPSVQNRHIARWICAYKLEQEFSKKALLWIYLNQVFLGAAGARNKGKGVAPAYGVEAAAQLFFNKSCKELTLAESALLAGLPKAPSRNNPFRNPANAIARQRWVLARMLSLGFITQPQLDQALAQPIVLHDQQPG